MKTNNKILIVLIIILVWGIIGISLKLYQNDIVASTTLGFIVGFLFAIYLGALSLIKEEKDNWAIFGNESKEGLDE